MRPRQPPPRRDPIPAGCRNRWIAWGLDGRVIATGVRLRDVRQARDWERIESYEFIPEDYEQ